MAEVPADPTEAAEKGPASETVRVLGVDAAGKHDWLGVVVDEDGFVGATVGSLATILDWAEPVAAIGIDIPIGGVRGAARAADVEARRFVQPRGSSVFPAPPLDVYDATDYKEANEILLSLGLKKLSQQAWALMPKIREVAVLAKADPRVFEVHPEVSFRELAGAGLPWSKRSWNGVQLRRRLLAAARIDVPDEVLGIADAGADDMLDATVAAWSARRRASGLAQCLPADPEVASGLKVAIWY